MPNLKLPFGANMHVRTVGYVLKFIKPMIFCCKAQSHALEFSLARVGIFGSKQNPYSSHISL